MHTFADSGALKPMSVFTTLHLPNLPDVTAPDGSSVRILSRLAGGSMAHFELPPGKTSLPVRHRTVEEIWYVLGGVGEMWRQQAEREEIVSLEAGVCLTIPLGTRFQFRATGTGPLTALAITMPPWPGEQEAEFVPGHWPANP